MQKKQSNMPYREICILAVGEIIVSAIVIAVFLIVKKYELSVLLGAILGSVVTVANFVWLAISVNRAFDKALLARGDGEMDEEAVERFTAQHGKAIENAAKLSYIIRTVSILAVLVLGFLIKIFNPISAVIPLLMYRPILTLGEIIKMKCIKQ